jgi:hypothetical protein
VPEYYEFIQRRLQEGVYRIKATEESVPELKLPLD